MSKKIFTLAIALSALGLILAGCQSGGDAGSTGAGGSSPAAGDSAAGESK
jgi:hypothetical protein